MAYRSDSVQIVTLGFDYGAVDYLDGVEERHAGAEGGTDFFDGVVAVGGAEGFELLAAAVLVGDEALGKGSGLDVGEDFLHGLLDGGGDDAGAGDVVAPLGGVGDGVAHVLEAAAVHEVDDELELVEDFEVGEFGLVACFDEGLEACLDEGGGATAEDGLFAEEVGFGLFGEGGFEDSAAGAADAFGVGEGEGEGVAGGVLLDGNESGYTAAFGEDLTDAVAGAFWCDERDIDEGGGLDGAEADVEAVGEHEGLAWAQVGLDVGVVDLGGGLVGGEVHDDVGPFGDFGDSINDEAGFAGALGVGGAGAEAYAYVDSGVLEVEGVGVALGAVADDGDFLCLDEGEVCVCVVVCLSHGVVRSFSDDVT